MVPHELLQVDSASTEDLLTDAAAHVLAARGAAGLSLRAVAEWLRVSPARVSQLTTRDHLPFVVTARFGQRWASWIEQRRWREGAFALLPADADQVPGFRVWLALGELSRHRTDLREFLDLARARERRALTDPPETGLSGREADLVLATADGLRTALCQGGEDVPASIAAAHSTLADLLGLLGQRSAEPASPMHQDVPAPRCLALASPRAKGLVEWR